MVNRTYTSSYFSFTLLLAAASVVFVCFSASPAWAQERDFTGGLGMYHTLSLSGAYGAYGPGDEDVVPPSLLAARLEVAGLMGATMRGNLTGFELGLNLGTTMDNAFSAGAMMTLLELGSGGVGHFRLGASLGVGLSGWHAFLYVRARLAMIIVPGLLDLEVLAHWTPDPASLPWEGTDYGIEVQRLRGTLWVSPFSESNVAFSVFGESERWSVPDQQWGEIPEVDGLSAGVGISFF